jgi:anaerobic magnesium-protoporphyrin IX monomethyl ester cyclase
MMDRYSARHCTRLGGTLRAADFDVVLIDAAIEPKYLKRIEEVVFGGWHSTLCPYSTLREPYVDAVVRGQGEITIVELAKALAGNNPLDLIAGISWKKHGRLIENFERRVQPVYTFDPPAFDLINFDAYEQVSAKRELAYATSVGSHTRVTTAPTWSSTSGTSMRTRPSASSRS